MNKSRFEGFSDGVFSFAITLLILGIVLPQTHYASNRNLTAALIGLWPNVIAYSLSFAVIGLMWQNHHALFRLVERIDRKTILLNLLLLAGTAFIPFATSTLGSYPTLQASTFLYGAVLAFCSTANNLMLVHLTRTHAFYDSVGGATIAQSIRAYRGAWVTYSRGCYACANCTDCQLCSLPCDRALFLDPARSRRRFRRYFDRLCMT